MRAAVQILSSFAFAATVYASPAGAESIPVLDAKVFVRDGACSDPRLKNSADCNAARAIKRAAHAQARDGKGLDIASVRAALKMYEKSSARTQEFARQLGAFNAVAADNGLTQGEFIAFRFGKDRAAAQAILAKGLEFERVGTIKAALTRKR